MRRFESRGLAETWSMVTDVNSSSDLVTVCHGDLWCNNVMFHYNHRLEPTRVKFIDYQVGCTVESV